MDLRRIANSTLLMKAKIWHKFYIRVCSNGRQGALGKRKIKNSFELVFDLLPSSDLKIVLVDWSKEQNL